jgi:hypothetical protein
MMALAEQSGSPHAIGLGRAMQGLAAFLRGDYRDGAAWLADGERILRDGALDARWEIDTSQLFLVSSQLYLGRCRAMSETVPVLLRDARERGDQYLATGLQTWRGNFAWLILDAPDEARRLAASEARGGEVFHTRHYYALLNACQIDLYCGDDRAAWERVEASWRAFHGSMLRRIQHVRIEGEVVRGRAALAAAAGGGAAREGLLREAERSALAIAREGAPWGDAVAAQLRGTAAALRGDRVAALALLERALAGYDAIGMGLFAAATRRGLGGLIGGPAGAAMQEAGEAWMRGEAVRDPDRMTRLFAPGLVGR